MMRRRVAQARLRHLLWRARAARPVPPAPPVVLERALVPPRGATTAVYCAFTPEGALRPYQHRALERLVGSGLHVVLVVNGGQPGLHLPTGLAGVLLRPNTGFDFSAWRDGLTGLRAHPVPERLLLINDSAYGPLTDDGAWWQDLPGEGVWSPVAAREPAPHLQSWLLVASGGAVGPLLRWFAGVRDLRDKREVVAAYEVGLSRWLRAQRVPLHSALQAPQDQPLRNPSHADWEALLDAGVPFIKRELLFEDPFRTGAAARVGDLVREQDGRMITQDLAKGRR